jgi:hypothetical protein
MFGQGKGERENGTVQVKKGITLAAVLCGLTSRSKRYERT